MRIDHTAYTASNGIPFNVRLINTGEPVGHLNMPANAQMIEFYDARFSHTKHGQFVSRYYLKTLSGQPHQEGLRLDGGVAGWWIDGETLRTILHDAEIFAE